MKPSRIWILALVLGLLELGVNGCLAQEVTGEDLFLTKIRPILSGTCFRCHGDLKVSGALRVDSRDALLQGGESGPAMVTGNPAESLLIRAIRRQEEVSPMPPEDGDALTSDQIDAFVTWIGAGASWPIDSAKFERTSHWAYEPIQDVPPPDVVDKSWAKDPLDLFIQSRWERAGFRPAPAADRPTLLRRATFDLTGLPPTPDEVAAFVNDESPDAFERVVDRLLASEAYGEHWGRHWLDVVRYADTAGETADYPVPLAWRYRNYVIHAFNSDKPYDEFLREQIAGDILARDGPTSLYAERCIATGYLAISRRFGFDSENYHHLTIQDTIDTLGQSVLGLSLGCARCHDHKFDPVSMKDYYALYGIFDSSRYAFPGSEQKQRVRALLPLLPPDQSRRLGRDFEDRVAGLSQQLERQELSTPSAIIRSLDEVDGDFELQAVAAGGSQGVLVPPWLSQGRIEVTHSAQSPFKNLYPGGSVGVQISEGLPSYRLAQGLHPVRTRATWRVQYLNLDFRVTSLKVDLVHAHRLWIGSRITVPGLADQEPESKTQAESPAVELLISSSSLAVRSSEQTRVIRGIQPGVWYSMQLTLDLENRRISVRAGPPGDVIEVSGLPFSQDWSGALDYVAFDSGGAPESSLPAIDFDNFSIQDFPLRPVSLSSPQQKPLESDSVVTLKRQLEELVGLDSDFELQVNNTPPTVPYNPGPSSVVSISNSSQSPYDNLFGNGDLGVHMPTRREYDGFGLTPGTVWQAAQTEHLYSCFDFRVGSSRVGTDGSWRFYLGHGPGTSAAVELFFDSQEFVASSRDTKMAVCPLVVGEWYQVQLALDLHTKRYTGVISWHSGNSTFQGEVAHGWDGTVDYLFFDSHGHLEGVHPALDVDNVVIGEIALPPFDSPSLPSERDQSACRREKVADIRQRLAATREELKKAQRELQSLLAEGPSAMAYGMAEGTPHDARIQLRGDPEQLGIEVPRGFLAALGSPQLPAKTPGSGRLELAQWLTHPDHPLTARVMVNRIWQYHFGRGLVKTPNDFGARGLPPSNPELLDHLAKEFVRHGWSVKAMHRTIMLCATYRQSSLVDASGGMTRADMDANDFYRAFARRRLTAEELRDTILAISGDLDRAPLAAHPFPSPVDWSFTQHAPFSAVYDHNRRSVYLMVQRLKRHPFLALFDGADPNATTADRFTTIVPTQALYFLNDPFVHEEAEQWARNLMTQGLNAEKWIERAYRQAIARPPTKQELNEATMFLTTYRGELDAMGVDAAEQHTLAAFLRALMGSNEFLYVE